VENPCFYFTSDLITISTIRIAQELKSPCFMSTNLNYKVIKLTVILRQIQQLRKYGSVIYLHI